MTLFRNFLQNTCLLTGSVNWSVWCTHLKSFYSRASRIGKELAGVPDHSIMALTDVVTCAVILQLTWTTAGFNFAQSYDNKRRAWYPWPLFLLWYHDTRSYFHSCFEISIFLKLSSLQKFLSDKNKWQWLSMGKHWLLSSLLEKKILQRSSFLFCLEIQGQFLISLRSLLCHSNSTRRPWNWWIQLAQNFSI